MILIISSGLISAFIATILFLGIIISLASLSLNSNTLCNSLCSPSTNTPVSPLSLMICLTSSRLKIVFLYSIFTPNKLKTRYVMYVINVTMGDSIQRAHSYGLTIHMESCSGNCVASTLGNVSPNISNIKATINGAKITPHSFR